MTLVRSGKVKKTQGAAGGQAPVQPPVAYAADTYGWALQQAEFLRAGRFDLIDAEHLAEEIDALAKIEMRVTRSAIQVVLQHLLKWDAQPGMRSRSWTLSIREHRRRVTRQLRDNPSLRPHVPTLIEEAYASARDAALDETGLAESAFSLECPYSWDEVMTRPIEWPEQT